MTVLNDTSSVRFVLPPDQEAPAPPEARGLARDEVRLLVADGNTVSHGIFRDLPRYLRPGDLVVVNDSATMNAAVDARVDGVPVVVHFATWLDDSTWVLEVRTTDGKPAAAASLLAGMEIGLPGGVVAKLLAPWLPPAERLWIAHLALEVDVKTWLQHEGRPITYSYVRQRWSPDYYRTVFARRLGSAEMPSASRPFTETLVTDLVMSGVVVAPITLHTGVSSPEQGEPPSPERFSVPESTARLVNLTHENGGRVITIGTTVTRALESAVADDGRASATAGWTNLVLGTHHPARVVDGIVTGWHAPGASHLMLLEAVAGVDTVREAYRAALAKGYLWHEFGDSALLVRPRSRQ
ncbi:S-adenosylmethionine:tRNA ribosyltransferase-isomerase [Aldersonia kunmingensis]|uniref:S-adenosylmethionine:tRNA ribosyltransferase-isomerase n=1 Tax=Aldersonia kunmingensis TaxID=408066 RepID=UPI00082ECFD8|nr:S-adenosylmethionine:tRNA ribosyltransferase-isomerase [Aldersonia kunmingensis]